MMSATFWGVWTPPPLVRDFQHLANPPTPPCQRLSALAEPSPPCQQGGGGGGGGGGVGQMIILDLRGEGFPEGVQNGSRDI